MRRRRASALLVASALGLPLLLPAQASAHGLVGRADLPIPSWLFGWAAAVVLIASFAALALLWPRPRLQQVEERPLFRIAGWIDLGCGLVGVALFALVVYSGLAGTRDSMANLAPTFVYVIFWVGLVLASALLGDVFRAFNPWLAGARATGWVGRRLFGERLPKPRAYPERLGYWPAAVTILGFAWLELCYTDKANPRKLAILALAYAGVQLAAMAWFGARTWSARGDGFGVYFSLFARLSPLHRRNGVLHVRPPLSGAPRLPLAAGTVALLCVAIGSTTFDGFSNGPVWASILPHLESVFSDLSAGQKASLQWSSSVGLLACVLLVGLLYRLGIEGMQTVGRGHDARELAGRFVHTLIPIAFAYALAHYFSLFAYQGQAAGFLISDPLGNGSDLFGTASVRIDYNLISSTGIWYVQVGALVAGHVAGLVLAHDRAVALYRRATEATRSQYWMLVVMVGFTSLGLWLLSAVNQ
jgi:hypothetical protein